MLVKNIMAGVAASALLATVAFAQSPTTTTDRNNMAPAASSTTNASYQGDWRTSKLVGLNVYNNENESIGSINDLLTDKSGNIKGVVIGVGGFLGVGEHLVAVAFDQIKFVDTPVPSTTTSSTAPASGTRPRPDHDRCGQHQHRAGFGDAVEVQPVVSGPRGVQRHQGSAEADARVQIFDLKQRLNKFRSKRVRLLPGALLLLREPDPLRSKTPWWLSGLILRCYACRRQEHLPPAHTEREDDMTESVYKVIELIGTSKDSWEKAAAAAVERAGKSLRDLRVAEVVKLDLQLDAKGKIEAYRAKLNISFKFED